MAGQYGDPAAANAAADRLLKQAQTLGEAADRLESRFRGITFEGPAATRTRNHVDDLSRRTKGAAGDLRAIAADIRRQAAWASGQIEAERRRAQQAQQAQQAARRK